MKRKMFMMFTIIIAGILATNCTKDTPLSDPEVQFNLNYVLSGGLKSRTDIPVCSDLPATYVMYKFDNSELKQIPVFYVSGKPWTSSIKMTTGVHTIQEFLVYNDNNTPNDLTDDILISAVPHIGSEFAIYVTTPLEQTFTIVNGKKTEIKLDVVCYQPNVSNNFGFVYFNINQINVKELAFFGDFCIKEKSDYANSLYAQQTNWILGTGYIDAPAIAKVEVWRNGILIQTVGNAPQGEKIIVKYSDNKSVVDAYEIKLFILVRQGTNFNYVMFKSWTFNDISNIPQGTDGLIDYILGNCYDPSSPPDLILAPWMNIPTNATYTITALPSTLGGYVDATLSNIPIGYDITNGVYGSNCADHTTGIQMNVSYNMSVYSSLYLETIPLFARSDKWSKINWLFNNLDHYPTHQWYDIQGFIWLYDNPVWNGVAGSSIPPLTALSQTMKADADLYGVNYSPLPGGWAAIIFIPEGTPNNATTATIQTMFIKIDP